MKSITLKITRTETWYPEISIPENDQSAFNHMSDDQAEEYISKLIEENEEWIYDEMRHKYTLDTDVETETFKENMGAMTLENKIEKALIDCRNRSKDNADLIAAATMQVGQDTFEDCGISDHKFAVYLVAQYLYENAPQLDHNSIQ